MVIAEELPKPFLNRSNGPTNGPTIAGLLGITQAVGGSLGGVLAASWLTNVQASINYLMRERVQ